MMYSLKSGPKGKGGGHSRQRQLHTVADMSGYEGDQDQYRGQSRGRFAGGKIENYYMYVTPSIYKPGALKSMKLGGNSNFGASTDVGFGFKWETKSGFGIASNLVDKSADSSTGLLNDGSKSKWDTQIAYTTDRWHLSATYSDAQNWSSQSYNATALAAAMKGIDGDTEGFAYRAYWMPENTGTVIPEISLGYDLKFADRPAAGAAKNASSYFVGLTWKDILRADDRIGLAATQPLKVNDCNGTCTTAEVEPFVWEAYYAFKPNDSMEIRPAIFGGSEVEDAADEDIFGAVVTPLFEYDCRDSRYRAHWDRWGFGLGRCVLRIDRHRDIGTANLTKQAS